MEWLWLLLVVAMAYLIGSISSAILIGKMIGGDDIRSHGSGNAGATNALRTYGKKAAILVLVLDCLKAVVAILLGMLLARMAGLEPRYGAYSAGVGAALGHNFPVYFHFRGGKGVLVSAVYMLFADWRIGLVVLVFAFLLMAITRYVSLGSILGATAFFVISLFVHWGDVIYLVFALIMAGTLVVMHHANIKRLLQGTESKLGQKKG